MNLRLRQNVLVFFSGNEANIKKEFYSLTEQKIMEAKMNNLTVWLKKPAPEVPKVFFEKVLSKSGFGVLNKTEHYFEPQGYTP